MTAILKLLTQYCDVYVDDINLKKLLYTNTPLYARRMWQILRPSIALFTIPAEMQIYLTGTNSHKKLTEPLFNSYRFVSDKTYTSTVTLNLDEEYKNFELFSSNLIETDEYGGVSTVEFPALYDEKSGKINISASEEKPLIEGTVIDFDFYTDGYFEENLSIEMLNILGVCFQFVWTDRFNTDWLSNVSKIEDRNFSEQNRANKMRADTQRLESIGQKLSGMMRRFEQNGFYRKSVSCDYKF